MDKVSCQVKCNECNTNSKLSLFLKTHVKFELHNFSACIACANNNRSPKGDLKNTRHIFFNIIVWYFNLPCLADIFWSPNFLRHFFCPCLNIYQERRVRWPLSKSFLGWRKFVSLNIRSIVRLRFQNIIVCHEFLTIRISTTNVFQHCTSIVLSIHW